MEKLSLMFYWLFKTKSTKFKVVLLSQNLTLLMLLEMLLIALYLAYFNNVLRNFNQGHISIS